ncbi:unnamed protein product [Rotaria sp. Silwood1]|nr:unnamed protein product [Rotaria sp. Silwood1]
MNVLNQIKTWNDPNRSLQQSPDDYNIDPEGQCLYIRYDIDTSPALIKRFLFECWQMKKPNVLISLIGGAKLFKSKDRIEIDFISGIIQLAAQANAWIITNGAKSGICELVGYAIAEHRLTNKKENITALAIAKWGAVKQDTYHPLRKLILEENLSINEVLAKLIGDYMEPLDEVDDIDCFYIPMRNNQVETISANEQRDRISVDPVERTIRDLFLWSVIMLRKEMCLVLIGHLSARICASLIASKIFKKCAQKYANTINIKTRLLGDANLFEKYAMKKLESCYDYDPVMACGLIIREIHLFGNVTCLQLQAMAFFVCVLFITIVAYGVTSRAMVYYGTFDFDGRQILMNVIYPQYFFIYGYFGNELTNLDAIVANNTTANVPATNGTVASAIATYVLFAFHILFVNILLINLLIAMFK